VNNGNLKVMPEHFRKEQLQRATTTDKFDVLFFLDRNPTKMKSTSNGGDPHMKAKMIEDVESTVWKNSPQF
jgi:hypothetical protein